MFMDEAKIVARLRHPNIIRYHELGSDDDQLFLAMELLFGQSLWSLWDACRARGVRLRYDMIAWIGARVADGPALRARARRRAGTAARHRAPGRQRHEHLRHLRRRDQGHRLRSGEGRQPRVEDGRRRHQGQGRVHVARAGRGRADRPAHRRLRPRDDALGARLRSAPLQAYRTTSRPCVAFTRPRSPTRRASSTASRRSSGGSSRALSRATRTERYRTAAELARDLDGRRSDGQWRQRARRPSPR